MSEFGQFSRHILRGDVRDSTEVCAGGKEVRLACDGDAVNLTTRGATRKLDENVVKLH
jgi:hypothetical protein